MKRLTLILVALALVSLMVVPAVWACDPDDPSCGNYAPDLKDFIRLACDAGSGVGCDHHIDVRGLLKLACETDNDCYKKDLKGLLQLACPAGVDECFRKELGKFKQLACETIDDCYKKDLFKGLMQLACDTINDCFKSDLPQGNQIASVPSEKKLAFMGVSKNVNPDDLEKRLASRTLPVEPKNIKPQKTAQTDKATQRLRKADPKDFPLLTAFLQKKIPVDAKDAKGNTLLLYMAARGNAQAVEYLLSKGADPKCTNKNGCSPLSCAKTKEIKKLMQLADKNEDGNLGSSRVPIGSPQDR